MKKEFRIKKSSEIDNVFKEKVSKGNDSFVIYYVKTDEPHFRFAISIGRKYGFAVRRNLCKRRIREIIRLNKEYIGKYLFVIVVKPKVSELSFKEINEKMNDVLKKIKNKNGDQL